MIYLLKGEDLTRTKIVCTIGPASSNYETIERMITAGMDVARLNFSHGTHSEHKASLERIRKASAKLGKPVAIMQDLAGPKIRIGPLGGKRFRLVRGKVVRFEKGSFIGDARRLGTTYERFVQDVRPGERILLNDGRIELIASRRWKDSLFARVVRGGEVFENEGVNLPDSKVSSPALTKKDEKDLAWAIRNRLDYVALSFVRTAEDLRRLRRLLKKAKSPISIVAKIEKPEALEHLQEIIAEADAVMIARGDLGVEMSLEQVPIWQKEIIRLCHLESKPVITATQMLESMREETTPTRAEVSDVANAISDGTDALMLSGETAIGRHPVAAVRAMDRIAAEAEKHFLPRLQREPFPIKPYYERLASALSHGTREVARVLDVKLTIAYTLSGITALYLSKRRIPHPIISVSPDPKTIRKMCLYWGVEPLLYRSGKTRGRNRLRRIEHSTLFDFAERWALKRRLAKKGDLILLVAGRPLGKSKTSNVIRIKRIEMEKPRR